MLSKSAQTTKTSNTSVNLKKSLADKHVGWNFYKTSTTNSNISLAHPTLSLTSYPITMTLTRGWILTNLESSYPIHSLPEKSFSKTTQKNNNKPSDKSTTLLQKDTLVLLISGSWLENTMKVHVTPLHLASYLIWCMLSFCTYNLPLSCTTSIYHLLDTYLRLLRS